MDQQEIILDSEFSEIVETQIIQFEDNAHFLIPDDNAESAESGPSWEYTAITEIQAEHQAGLDSQIMDIAEESEAQAQTQLSSEPSSEPPITTMYVISTVLDEATGQLINVLTPYHPEMPSGETVTDNHRHHQDLIPILQHQDQSEYIVGELRDEDEECPEVEVTQYISEHDYDNGQSAGGATVFKTEESIPGVVEEPDESNMEVQISQINEMPLFSIQDVRPMSIVRLNTSQYNNEGPLAGANGSENQTPAALALAASTSSKTAETAEAAASPRKKMSNEDGKIRNIDQMRLPFSYAGQSFTVQAQKLILNVYDFFKRNKKDVYALDRIGTPQEKAGRCLNVSSSVIGKIRKRYKGGRIEVPGKKRIKAKRVLDKVDSSKEQILREILHEMVNNKIPATVPALLEAARERINFDGSRTSFRRILQRMGYKYEKVNNKVIVVDMDSSQN